MTKTPKDKNKYSESSLLYWFNKYWVFPDTSHAHWEPSTRAYREIVAIIKAFTNLRNKSLMKLAQDLGIPFSVAKVIHDHAQPTITEKDIEGWASEAQYSVQAYEDWGYVVDIMKEMLEEIGVEIIPSQESDK